jgi:glycosyltransferase involved in cell wall biosynthesis
LGIKNNVDFLGWHKDLAGIYASLDIITLTSINEGTPVSLIEAMACARTVVATDVGGIRDLLGDEVFLKNTQGVDFKVLERGIMVKSRDVVNFAAALNFALRDSVLRRKMGEKARAFVKGKFTKDRLIKDIESLYSSLLFIYK